MRAKKLRCDFCNESFLGCRSDTKYCSSKCRTKKRYEDAKFQTPNIPKSNIEGITYSRIHKKWSLKIKGKYLGLFESVDVANVFRLQYLGQ